jgi:hypothetical protein
MIWSSHGDEETVFWDMMSFSVVMLANVSEDTDDYVLIAEELVLMDKWF